MNIRRPRIGLYQPYPHTFGGMQVIVLKLAKALPEYGYEPFIILPEAGSFTERLCVEGVPFLVCDPGEEWHVYGRGANSLSYAFSPRRLVRLIGYWRKLGGKLRDNGISILHCNDYRAVMLAAPAARLAGIPVVWHMHGFVNSRLVNVVASLLATWKVPVSQGMLDYLKLPRWLFGKYQVICNGVESEPAIGAPPTPHGPPVVVAVGTLHPRKGYEVLLHAFRAVIQKLADAECWIAGGQYGDGSYGRRLRELASQLGLDRHVKFLGHSTDVDSLLHRANLLAVPSRIEVFGLVAVEAMLVGKPVVACRTGGLKDIIVHRETGILVAPQSEEEMAEALLEILGDRDLARRMGHAGQARVREHFRLDRMAGAFAEFYARIFCHASPPRWKGEPYVQAG